MNTAYWSVACTGLQLLVGRADQRALAHHDATDAIDMSNAGHIRLTDFTEPCPSEQRNEWHPEARAPGALIADLVVAALAVDVAAICLAECERNGRLSDPQLAQPRPSSVARRYRRATVGSASHRPASPPWREHAQSPSRSVQRRWASGASLPRDCQFAVSARFRTGSATLERPQGRYAGSGARALVEAHLSANPVAGSRSSHGAL